jgi:hypothetical protein
LASRKSALPMSAALLLTLTGCTLEKAQESAIPVPPECAKYFDGYGAKREVVIVDKDFPGDEKVDVRLRFAENYLDRPFPLGPKRVRWFSSQNFIMKLSDATAFDPKWRFSDEGRLHASRTEYAEQLRLSVSDGRKLEHAFALLSMHSGWTFDPNALDKIYKGLDLTPTEMKGVYKYERGTFPYGNKDLLAKINSGKLSDYFVCDKPDVMKNMLCEQNFEFKELWIRLFLNSNFIYKNEIIKEEAINWLNCVYVSDEPASGREPEDTVK